MAPAPTTPVGHRFPISHVAYVVPDLEAAVARWVETMGAGPFVSLGDVKTDVLDCPDGPAVWKHKAAFGAWAPIAVELQQLDEVSPPSLATALGAGTGRMSHVAYVVPDPDQESERLTALGLPRFLRAHFGPIEITLHDVPALGHAIELHRDGDEIADFLRTVQDLAVGWDGRTDPLRDAADL